METHEDSVQGRFCVATKHFDVGDVILRCDPLVEMLINPTQYCSNCYSTLASTPKPARCPSCRRFAYCCEECRAAHWDSAHSKECRAVALFDNPYMQSVAAFIVRILNSGDKWTFLRPSPAYNPSPDAGSASIPATYAAVYETMVREKAVAPVPPETLGLMFACVYNNSFTVERRDGPQRENVGVAVYLEASLFSHSCVCNTSRSFSGKTVCFRASRPIEPGDEIVITYTDKLDEPLGVRRQALYAHFGFVCRCKRCLAEESDENGGDLAGLYEEKGDIETALKKVDKLLDEASGSLCSKAFLYKKAVSLCERMNDLKNLLRYKCLLADNSVRKLYMRIFLHCSLTPTSFIVIFGKYSVHTLTLLQECELLAEKLGESDLQKHYHDVASEVNSKISFI